MYCIQNMFGKTHFFCIRTKLNCFDEENIQKVRKKKNSKFATHCVNIYLFLYFMLQTISLLQTTIAFGGDIYVPWGHSFEREDAMEHSIVFSLKNCLAEV